MVGRDKILHEILIISGRLVEINRCVAGAVLKVRAIVKWISGIPWRFAHMFLTNQVVSQLFVILSMVAMVKFNKSWYIFT